ncbi:pyroglutamyl-peptidase I [Pelosinus propionicus]|uniref:Pyrrolidone-carboxylate peptidase n=1 Tax=Pelosinus propionicus DSM 13327 TaxID=1123291 RepID=A0A1I4PMH7_9FIRM|nr:pyroglutamyl-peptidase I [Pelosinus propionicus]SFM28957.1 pyroglutamyl-peptidase [Pelosinus propionicus DSM 13327]
MKVLVTGFDPFGGESVNPALEAIKKLDGRIIADSVVTICELPTVRRKAIVALREAIFKIDPAVIIAVGQAGGRMEITPERVAINIDDFRIKDNEGNNPIDEPIEPFGLTAYWSTLPIKKMVEVMRENGVPASVSNSAGTFVCNHLFYGLMHQLCIEGNKRRGGFIHIPYLPEQVSRSPGQPSMSLDMIVRGLEIAIEVALTTAEDCQLTGGTIC